MQVFKWFTSMNDSIPRGCWQWLLLLKWNLQKVLNLTTVKKYLSILFAVIFFKLIFMSSEILCLYYIVSLFHIYIFRRCHISQMAL